MFGKKPTNFCTSPSACEAFFLCVLFLLVVSGSSWLEVLRIWQTCRNNSLMFVVVDEWTWQFQNNKVVVFYTILSVIFKIWHVINQNDFLNTSDPEFKSTLYLILVKSYLLLKYLSSTVSFIRSSSDGLTNAKMAMCCGQYGVGIQDSSATSSFHTVYLPWDG